jgi:hypothetical protein
MNKRTLGVAAVFLVGCAVGGASSQIVVSKVNAQQAVTLTKWQYHCEQENGANQSTQLANKLGAQAWELVGSNGSNVWCFKRVKR